MFSIKYRYLFIILLAVYSFVNILFTAGIKLIDAEIPYLYLFALIFLEVLLIWELNRYVGLRLFSIHTWIGRKIHPLLILFACSLVNVMLASVVSLGLLYVVLQDQIVRSTDHLVLVLAFGFDRRLPEIDRTVEPETQQRRTITTHDDRGAVAGVDQVAVDQPRRLDRLGDPFALVVELLERTAHRAQVARLGRDEHARPRGFCC